MNEQILPDSEKDSVETAFWCFLDSVEIRETHSIWNRALIERLFCMHFGSGDNIGLEFWDVADHSYDPLFFREDFTDRLKSLSSFDHAVFILSGLRHAMAGSRVISSQKFKQAYANEVTFLREMCKPWCNRASLFHLIML